MATKTPNVLDMIHDLEDHVRKAEEARTTAEKERDDAKAQADALQNEKNNNWVAKKEAAKKAHPGQVSLLKMYAAASREEWEGVRTFLAEFEGYLPVGLLRIHEGANALLDGPEPKKDTTPATKSAAK